MTTEAEQLANDLVGGYSESTWLESEAAAMLRSQAAEIDRLRAEANTCGAGAGCCAQAAEIERLNFIIGALEGSLTSLEDKDKEIERLKAEANTCGSGAGCCAQAAEIERLKAEAELFAKHIGLKLSRKDALLRCIYDNTTMADWPADIEERIEKELGL